MNLELHLHKGQTFLGGVLSLKAARTSIVEVIINKVEINNIIFIVFIIV